MIARVLITITTTLAVTSAVFAQQPAQPREVVGTTGTTPTSTPPTSATPAPTPAPAVPAAAACAARAPEAAVVAPRDYRIGPEDILDINVWKNPELSRERIPVRPDGKVSHPLINDIDVAGLTASQVKAEVTQRLSKFIENPEVSVVLREIHSPKVSV